MARVSYDWCRRYRYDCGSGFRAELETTGHEVLKTVHPHPTMSEAVMEAVAAAYDEVFIYKLILYLVTLPY